MVKALPKKIRSSTFKEDEPYGYSDLQRTTDGYSIKEARRKIFTPEGGLFGNL